jgi:CheY-like chemotaxis protein
MLASLRPGLKVLALEKFDSVEGFIERDSRPKRIILAVEDHDEARYVVVHHLRNGGFEVLEASTGNDALKTAHRADAIVLDIHLPDLMGFEVCKRLKADPTTAHIPVIFLTATAQDSESVQRGREAGAVAFLFSPVEPASLIEVLHNALAA